MTKWLYALTVSCLSIPLAVCAQTRSFGVGGALVRAPRPLTHFISAEPQTLVNTLLSARWWVRSPACWDDAPGASYVFDIMRDAALQSETLAVLHVDATPPQSAPLGAYLTTTGEPQACDAPDAQLTADLLDGIALLRSATADSGAALPWIELRHAPREIDQITQDADAFTCSDAPPGVPMSIALLPAVVPLSEPVLTRLCGGKMRHASRWR